MPVHNSRFDTNIRWCRSERLRRTLFQTFPAFAVSTIAFSA
jgi:hypothetical protein